MNLLEIIFWLSVACVLYTYALYPILVKLAATLVPTKPVDRQQLDTPVSVILAVRNEEARIRERVRELARLVAARTHGGELIVVSDGSTDGTIREAQSALIDADFENGERVTIRILGLQSHLGKAVALNEGYAVAGNPILVFADVRQRWALDAFDNLLANFADTRVGAVSGELVVESAPGVMAGVSLYWRFEKWLRQAESHFGSMVSVTGSISAVRRELFKPIPPGTILDDVYWPLAVALHGHRVVHEDRAFAYDRLPDRAGDEFRRKVRTLAGNFQLMARLPRVLVPWRNPVWWQFVSHRTMRLVAPWALLIVLLSNIVLTGLFYEATLLGQFVFYLLGVAGSLPSVAARSRLASAIASFIFLNAAAWIAFWVWVLGRTGRSWTKARYAIASSAGHLDPAGSPASAWAHRPELRQDDR